MAELLPMPKCGEQEHDNVFLYKKILVSSDIAISTYNIIIIIIYIYIPVAVTCYKQ